MGPELAPSDSSDIPAPSQFCRIETDGNFPGNWVALSKRRDFGVPGRYWGENQRRFAAPARKSDEIVLLVLEVSPHGQALGRSIVVVDYFESARPEVALGRKGWRHRAALHNRATYKSSQRHLFTAALFLTIFPKSAPVQDGVADVAISPTERLKQAL